MPRKRSVNIQLTVQEKMALSRWRKEGNSPLRSAVRANIVARAAAGETNYGIAKEMGISRNTVKLWRYRYARERLQGLSSRPIPGRPKLMRDYGSAPN